ncbi:MBL fold metallo-hydrolase [Paenibacillus lutrae]|uniref:MBL fold metallo-hydrolase n=1 Tax=Paenibacillus lutrae TaxID=2078573 RepID=A0A7X3FLE3_9BACL|nr:ribonuclease Z [Paenibacillus lutrae]MVP01919.1 MBL fold metallo-hydrolase [Paenibacillus lutrae]
MNVLIMGSASATGSRERDNTYLLLQHELGDWLIDTGGNPLGKLKQASIPLDRIQGVILTHFHIDHIYGLPSLLWGMWLGQRKKPLIICCPHDHRDQLQAILDAYGTEKWPVGFEIQVRPYDCAEETLLLRQGDLSVTSFTSLHSGSTAGMKIRQQDKILIYSCDTAPNPWIRDQEQVDVLIHEATEARGTMSIHTSLENIFQYYPLERIGQVIAIHLTDDEPYEEVIEQYKESGTFNVTLAQDMMRVDL